MDFKIVIPVIISFVISVILATVIIPFLRRLKASQTERTDGVKSHLSKAGTPTDGWSDLSDRSNSDIFVLCKRLSEDHSDLIPDAGIWSDRIPG